MNTVVRIPILLAIVAGLIAAWASPAHADDSATADQLDEAAATRITAQVTYRSQPSAAPIALADVDVALWKLDTGDDRYHFDQQFDGPIPGGLYTSPELEPGTYGVQFRTGPDSGIGMEYYSDARYWSERTDVVVTAGETVDLGAVVLEPRYVDVWRFAGADRFATAVEISKQVLPDDDVRAPVVYIANGYKFPDALAAGPAASVDGGVILTTRPDALPGVVADELKRIAPRRVVITGDTASVSAAVAASIAAIVPDDTVIERMGGAGRYETAELIVRDAFGVSGSDFAIIATGANYPDALAAGPAAAFVGAPVILVNGRGGLDARTIDLIEDFGISEVLIAGSASTVSSAIESGLVGLLGSDAVGRAAGVNRYDTATQINWYVIGETDEALLATGTGFADALTGGPLAAAWGAPLHLTPGTCLGEEAWWGIANGYVNGLSLLGGEPTLSTAVEDLEPC